MLATEFADDSNKDDRALEEKLAGYKEKEGGRGKRERVNKEGK